MKKAILAAAALLLAGTAAALTPNRVVKASSQTYITDSLIQDNGTGVSIATTPVSGSTFAVNGLIHSLLNGYKFPDGTTQTTAAGGLTIGNSVSGGGANRLLFEDSSQNLAASANMTYNEGGLGALAIYSASPSGGITANFTNTAGTNNAILNLTNQVANSTASVKFGNDFAIWGIGVGGDDAFFVYDQAKDARVLSVGYNAATPIVAAQGYLKSTSGGVIYPDGSTQTVAANQFTLFTATTTGTHGNSTTEGSIVGVGIGSKTLPANFLTVGKTVRFKVQGKIFADSVAPGTVQFIFKLGSVNISSTTAFDIASFGDETNGSDFTFEGTFTCRSTGASGTVMPSGFLGLNLDGGSGLRPFYSFEQFRMSSTPVTIDTTATQELDLLVDWGTADSDNTMSGYIATIEVLGGS